MTVRFRIIREKKELTQQKMADILGISKTNYNYFENEERFIPLKHLNNYCNEFNMSMDYIFYLTDINKTSKNNVNLNRKLVGKRIKQIRNIYGLTQQQLADILHTTQSTICSYEKGDTLILTSFLFEMCKRLNVSMDYITGRSNVIRVMKVNNN